MAETRSRRKRVPAADSDISERRVRRRADAYAEFDYDYERPSPRPDPRRKKRRKRKKKKHRILHFFRILFLIFLFFGLLLTLAGIGFAFYQVVHAPDISVLTETVSPTASFIVDEEGTVTRKLSTSESNRIPVGIKDIPEDLQHAVVAIEDSRFYKHHGIDPKGIIRALVHGITRRSFSEGASTITQQLLKNAVFTGWTNETLYQKFVRKFQEQYMAFTLEKSMSKDEILEKYLNIINLGSGTYGVEAASEYCFNKHVSELTLSECAVLAAIPQNPTYMNPINYPERNGNRRETILKKMVEQGYITEEQRLEAMEDDVYDRIAANSTSETPKNSTNQPYSYFEDALISDVIECLREKYGYSAERAHSLVYEEGITIVSAQDADIQKICDEEVLNSDNYPKGTEVGIDYALSIQKSDGSIQNLDSSTLRYWVRNNLDSSFNLLSESEEAALDLIRRYREACLTTGDTLLGERISLTPQPESSVVIIDPSTSLIRAIVGGREEKKARLTLNRATDSLRQPGSTFKILSVYAPALNEKLKDLTSVYENSPYNYADGTPVSNWNLVSDGGELTIREAIAASVNIIAVKCLTDISPELGFDYAERFGISTLEKHYETANGDILTDITQSLALGGITKGVSNLELCNAYATIANSGVYNSPHFFVKVTDRNGEVLLDSSEYESRQVISEGTSWLLTSAMEDVISTEEGTANGLIDLGQMAVAGKSGTTENYRDIWFTGYTPYYACSVWGGYDNGDSLPDIDLGHSYCKVLWQSIMSRIHKDLPSKDFTVPNDVVRATVCRDSGQQANPDTCPNTVTDWFLKDHVPKKSCELHPSAFAGNDEELLIVRTETTANFTDPEPAPQPVEKPETPPAAEPETVLPAETEPVTEAPPVIIIPETAESETEQKKTEKETEKATEKETHAALPDTPETKDESALPDWWDEFLGDLQNEEPAA